MQKIINNLKSFRWKSFWESLKALGIFIWSNIIFLVVLLIYVIRGLFKTLIRLKFLGKLFVLLKFELAIKGLTKLMYKIDVNKDNGVARSYLIELSFRNMKAKKNRAFVTIGGVAVGVGAIVFLVSIGYGLEELVISKVAKLDELKMIDVSLGKSLSVKLDDEVIEKIKSIKDVTEVVPVVSMVSKIKFNNSVFDVMSFAVDERYIKIMDPNFVAGEKFIDKDKNFVFKMENANGVLGVNREIEMINESMKADTGIFEFNVNSGENVMVFDDCSIDSEALGYVIRSEGGYIGEEKWGEAYSENGDEVVGMKSGSSIEYSKWIRAKVPLWLINDEGKAIPKLMKEGQQEWVVGCFKKDGLVIEKNNGNYQFKNLDRYLVGEVLGEAIQSAQLATASATMVAAVEATQSADLFDTVIATDSAGIEWVELKKVSEDPNKLKEVDFNGVPAAEAYISSGMLKLLGLAVDKAVGESFKVSYVVPDGSIKGVNGRLQSKEVDYKIKGIIEDEASNYYYYQMADARRLGVGVYSQLKVLIKDQTALGEVRKNIEGIGLKTDSTVDTVSRIESLFKTFRIILGFLGTIALAVASLGMFNTMTVSLLERTREVGVMKAMGMLSNEVRELFLAESMIMGVGGGVLGILLGYILGRILSLVLSSISLANGQGFINVATIPWFFTLFILGVSFLVGIVTGWYPSKRARQISALNALRYE